jgi:hypothetical protein
MSAIILLALKVLNLNIWVPFLVGMVVGGLCLVTIRVLQRPGPVALPPPPPPPNPVQKVGPGYDPFVHGSPSEQRKAHRRAGNPVEVFVTRAEETTPFCRAWVIDRSVEGVALSLSNELKPEMHLQLRPVTAPAITPWTEVEVKSCRPVKDGFELGCQFVKKPQWSVLLLFG